MNEETPTYETPETPEKEGRTPETQKLIVNNWISDIIAQKQSIEDITAIRDAINDPTKYDDWIKVLRNDIDLKYREDADRTNEPIDKDIVKKCFENKEFIIAKMQKNLFSRELAERDLHKYWTGYVIKDTSGNALDPNQIQDIIETIPTNQLAELTKNITKSINFLSEYTITTPHITQYISAMGIDIEKDIDPKERKKLLFQFAVFEGTGDFDEEMLSILFEHIPDTDKKREAIKMILPKISLKDAIEKGIISEDKQQDILESVFFEYLRDNGLLTGGESKLDDWLAHSNSTIAHQREYHKNAFIAEASKNTGGVFLDTEKQEFFQDGVAFSESGFDHGAFDAGFAAMLPLLNTALKDRLIDNETQNQKELVDHSGTFDDMKTYLGNQELPSLAKRNIHLLGDEIFICTESTNPTGGDTQKRTWKIKNSHEMQDGIAGLRLISYNTLGEVVKDEFVSYGQFAKDFIKEASLADEPSIRITPDEPEFLQPEELINTLSEFTSILDEMDPDGKKHPLENDLCFTVEMNGEKEVVRIESILEASRQIRIVFRDGKSLTLNWLTFIDQMKEGNDGGSFEFRRIGKFGNQNDFLSNSAISGSLKYDNGKMQFEDTVENKSGGTEKKWTNLKVLSNGKGEHILIKKYDAYNLEIWHYEDKKEDDKNGETKTVMNTDGTPKKAYSKYKGVSYEQLEEFVQRGFDQPRKDVPKGQTTQEENENKYKNKSLLWGVLSQPGSLYSKYLAVKMGWQKLQSNREQKAQVDAAETMYEWAKRYLPEGSDMRYAFTAEFSHTVGGEINKKMEEIGTLGPTEKRKKIQKILLTKPPKPYELFAALIVTAKMSGELYPDAELSPLQGEKYMWFTALAEAMHLDPQEELKAAKKKVISEYGPQKDHLPETALVTRLFKKNNTHPYVTAIGGGSKYWHAVTEGLEGQQSKGEKETKVLSGPAEVSAYAMSKFKSNELPIVAGAIPQIYAKDPKAEHMAPAFVWAMSNATRIVRGSVNDVMVTKNIFQNGSFFHSFAFSKTPEGAKKYQDCTREVVKYLVKKGKISSAQGAKFEELYKQVQENPNTHNNDIFEGLQQFWDANYEVLHPILQGSSPDLMIMHQDGDYNNRVIEEYLKSLSTLGHMKGQMTAPVNEEILIQGGYSAGTNGSMNFELKQIGGTEEDPVFSYEYRSLKYITDKCSEKINGHNLTMNTATYRYFWKGQIEQYVNSLRTNEVVVSHPEFQKKQYMQALGEIVGMVRTKVGEPHHPEEVFERAKEYQDNNYLKDLEKLGVDISDYNTFVNGDLDTIVASAYSRFIRSTPQANSTKELTRNVPQKAKEALDKRITTGEMGKPANDADWEFKKTA